MSDLTDVLAALIKEHAERVSRKDVWNSGKFKDIKTVSNDTRGEMGESFIAEILKQFGLEVEHSKGADRTEKHWDLRVNGKVTLEIKTATIDKNGRMFQHENIEKDRNYDYLVLLDIAPDAIYLTVAPKGSLPFKEKSSTWTVNPKAMHRRAHGIQYKWDLNLNDVKNRKIKTLKDAQLMLHDVIEQSKTKK